MARRDHRGDVIDAKVIEERPRRRVGSSRRSSGQRTYALLGLGHQVAWELGAIIEDIEDALEDAHADKDGALDELRDALVCSLEDLPGLIDLWGDLVDRQA